MKKYYLRRRSNKSSKPRVICWASILLLTQHAGLNVCFALITVKNIGVALGTRPIAILAATDGNRGELSHRMALVVGNPIDEDADETKFARQLEGRLGLASR